MNFFEAFVPLCIFAKGEFDKKIHGIFKAFDLDDSEYIDKKEMVVFLHCAIFGLCKFVKIPLPRRDDVNNFAYTVFRQIDRDKNEMYFFSFTLIRIEEEEFAIWIKESDEIQDFLLKYTGQQTFERARKRY